MSEDAQSGFFAIAITMTKDIPTGFNILTRLNIWAALSEDEAVGRAVQDAQAANPDHQIFSIAKMRMPSVLPEATP